MLLLEKMLYICVVYILDVMEKVFMFGTATSGINFTDREEETARLVRNFSNQTSGFSGAQCLLLKNGIVQSKCVAI